MVKYLYNSRRMVVFTMGKETPSAQADTAAFFQLREEDTVLKKENEELRRKLERMNELLLNAQRARFGQSSERRSYVIPEQLGMFNEAEAEQDHKAPESTEEALTVKEHQRKRKPKRTAGELTAGLPVKEVVLEFPEDERSCSTCGHPLKQIEKKFLHEELEIIPQQIRVIKYYSATYACENCEKESGYAHIYSVKAPPPPDQTQPGLPLHGSQCHDPEVRGRAAAVPAGEDLGAGGHRAEPGHHGELGDPDGPDLAETAVPAAEKASAGEPRHLRGRDGGAGAEGGRKTGLLGVPDVGLWQRGTGRQADPFLRVPAEPQRETRGRLPEGLYRLPGDRRLRRLQPGSRRSALRLLGTYAAEMAGGNAEGRPLPLPRPRLDMNTATNCLLWRRKSPK